MNAATIFCNDGKWLKGEKCFGVRFDTMILPIGSWVVGFLVWENKEIRELLDKPHTSTIQDESWEAAIAYARDVLQKDWSSLEESDKIL